jgi:chlorite dismutase
MQSPAYTAPPQHFSFSAGAHGKWSIVSVNAVTGESLPTAPRLEFRSGEAAPGATWTLRGFTSNARYTTRAELATLSAKPAPLGRAEATCAALIPIAKSAAWWALAQDARREILAIDSQHIAIGSEYLPAIARQLHHCRDLGEPFDFLTWFEFAPEHEQRFEQLVARLRTTPEWRYVEREVEIRLVRERSQAPDSEASLSRGLATALEREPS